MGSWVDAVTFVTSQLQYVAPVYVGARFIPQNDAPPRIVVVPIRETYSQPGAIGGNPRLLCNANVELAWHCWGIDYATTTRLIQSVITSIRLAMGTGSSPNGGQGSGTGSVRLGETIWYDKESTEELGFLAVLPTTLVLGVPEALIPTAPGPSVTDNTFQTVVVTAGALDPSGAVAGDGILQGGEG